MKKFIPSLFECYSILFLCFVSVLACSKEKEEITPLRFEELEGNWRIQQWQTSSVSSFLSPINLQFTEINKSGIFQNVPNNTWGYREDEVIFRALTPDLSRPFAMLGEMLIKEENSSIATWFPVIIFKPIGSSEEFLIEVDCGGCFNNFLTMKRL